MSDARIPTKVLWYWQYQWHEGCPGTSCGAHNSTFRKSDRAFWPWSMKQLSRSKGPLSQLQSLPALPSPVPLSAVQSTYASLHKHKPHMFCMLKYMPDPCLLSITHKLVFWFEIDVLWNLLLCPYIEFNTLGAQCLINLLALKVAVLSLLICIDYHIPTDFLPKF